MTNPTDSAPIRIPLAHSIVYAVRGVPEIADEYNATRTIAPTEIALTYRAAPDSQLGRVHAYVKGWWMENGARVPMDKPVGRHLYGGPEAWPAWLAEEARLHDPDALAVLPPDGHTTNRADVLREAADAVAALKDKTDVNVAEYQRYDFRQRCALGDAESLLRRLAAEAQQPDTETPSPTDEDFAVAIDSVLDRLLPAIGVSALERTRDQLGGVLRPLVEQLRRERDLAIAHDRQPYPTAWAYEQACKALHRKTDALDRVREFLKRHEHRVAVSPLDVLALLDEPAAVVPAAGAGQDETQTPCSVPECNVDGTGEPCFNHEREQAHAEGDHAMCSTECTAIMTAPEAWRD